MKKIFLSMAAFTSIMAPIATTIACSSEKKLSVNNNLGDLTEQIKDGTITVEKVKNEYINDGKNAHFTVKDKDGFVSYFQFKSSWLTSKINDTIDGYGEGRIENVINLAKTQTQVEAKTSNAYKYLLETESLVNELAASDSMYDGTWPSGSTKHKIYRQWMEDKLNTILGTTSAPDNSTKVKRHEFTFTAGSSVGSRMKYSDDYWQNQAKLSDFPQEYQDLRNAETVTQDKGKATWETYVSWRNSKTEAKESELAIQSVPGENMVVTFKANAAVVNPKTLILGAQYDHNQLYVGTGATGTNDNNTGASMILAMAEFLKDKTDLKHNIVLGLWDYEEHGLIGSRGFAKDLISETGVEVGSGVIIKKDDVMNYINMDGIAGGDNVYLGWGKGYSGGGYHGENTSFHGENIIDIYNDKIMNDATNIYSPWVFDGDGNDKEFPINLFQEKGETYYSGSDHNSFMEQGISALNFESTNYEVYGTFGVDGYSQTSNPKYWYGSSDGASAELIASDPTLGTVYGIPNVKKEGLLNEDLENDGRIWHTKHDNLAKLENDFGNRIKFQLYNIEETLKKILLEWSDYVVAHPNE